jgi:uncharacterized protein (DUF983 family)
MKGKGTKLYSILKMKCPKCHEGELFKESNPYKLKELSNMYPKCEVCGEDFKREPGFYFGAAYVSYALTVALWVAVLVALITFDALGWIEYSFFENPLTFLFSGIIALFVLLPVLYRLSRSIWLNFFINYDSKAIARKEDQSKF